MDGGVCLHFTPPNSHQLLPELTHLSVLICWFNTTSWHWRLGVAVAYDCNLRRWLKFPWALASLIPVQKDLPSLYVYVVKYLSDYNSTKDWERCVKKQPIKPSLAYLVWKMYQRHNSKSRVVKLWHVRNKHNAIFHKQTYRCTLIVLLLIIHPANFDNKESLSVDKFSNSFDLKNVETHWHNRAPN